MQGSSDVKEKLVVAALVLTMSTPWTGGQQATQLPAGRAPQQAIPDAPKPQTPGISAVTPGQGTTSTSNAVSTPADTLPDDQFQPAVTDKLPSTPTDSLPDEDPGAAPDLPATPIGSEGLPSGGTLRLRVNYVEVPFTVKDSKGRPVPGLTWRDVRVYENNVRQQLRRFIVDPVPMSMAVVVDQSLDRHVMATVNNSLDALNAAFAPYDEVAVFTYNNGPRELTTFTGGSSPRLVAAIDQAKAPGRDQYYYAPGEGLGGPTGIKINGGADDHINPLVSGGPGSPTGVSTSQVPREVHTLNDAILEAAKATTKAGKGRRRVVYVISDGKEYGSIAKTKQVIKYLQTNKVEVFATVVGDSSLEGIGFLDRIHLPLLPIMRDNILPVYANATGGQVYADFRQKAIERSFAQITEAVRNQYVIGYNSRESFLDEKFRKIEVKVMKPNLNVIAKSGYYPSPGDGPAPVAPQKTALQ